MTNGRNSIESINLLRIQEKEKRAAKVSLKISILIRHSNIGGQLNVCRSKLSIQSSVEHNEMT